MKRQAFRFNDERDWFFEARFGLFVHFGLYSLLGDHEQVMHRKGIPRDEYRKLLDQFNPTAFDPHAWIDLAERTGMRYICLTTKHHDGFCLWDTKQTEFNVMRTPYGRDIVGMLAEACHERNFPLELYYSVVDWWHPNYPNQGRHHELPPQPDDNPDEDRYLSFLKAQVRELCTNYGEIHGIWWDMNVPEWRDPSVHAMIRELQPKAVINSRGFDEGDFDTPERFVPEEESARPIEGCQSLGAHSWGYKEDEDFYAHRYLMKSMGRIFSMGGNYLLNVGPRPDGTVQPEFVKGLDKLGAWYTSVREAYTDTDVGPDIYGSQNVRTTVRGHTLYIHILLDLPTSAITFSNIRVQPKAITLLNDGRKLDFRMGDNGLSIRTLPVNESPEQVLVVKLDFQQLPNFSIPVQEVSEDGEGFTLNPETATFFGGNIKVVRKLDGGTGIGWWNSVDQSAVWKARLAAPGKYRVQLTAAMPEAGNRIALTVDGMEFALDVPATGNWETYATHAVGDVHLSAGEMTVSVAPRKVVNESSADIRAIHFEPI